MHLFFGIFESLLDIGAAMAARRGIEHAPKTFRATFLILRVILALAITASFFVVLFIAQGAISRLMS